MGYTFVFGIALMLKDGTLPLYFLKKSFILSNLQLGVQLALLSSYFDVLVNLALPHGCDG